MERFTISLDPELAAQFDALIQRRAYQNRSEAVRDLIRSALEHDAQQAAPEGPCMANLSYVYHYRERALAERLLHLQHTHHDLVVSSMHSHIDHDHGLETLILRGPRTQVQALADTLSALPGVRHGQLNLVSLESGEPHSHGHDHTPHLHHRPQR